MKTIPLTKGMEALVDDEDYEYLMQCNWYANARGYAAHDSIAGRVLMHRLIGARLGFNPGFEVDHRNRNTLDNRRENLRPATSTSNKANARKRRDNTSGFKGVCEYRPGRWVAYISCDRKRHHLGTFTNIIDAAKAYNAAAIKYFGEFACLNPV